jgi:predicted ATPase
VDFILSESPLRALKQDLLSHRLGHELTLHGLRQADVAAYLASEFTGGGLPEDLATMIHRRSEGNPLFMTAMLDHLAQTGVLARENGSWKVTSPLDRIDPGVPETLKHMLDVQLGHLSEDERRLLKCASVAGQHFTPCSVAIMLESASAEIEQKCTALAERQQFLKSCGKCELPNGVFTTDYEFRHSLYREALYRGLSAVQRVNLHRSLANGLVGYESPQAPVLAAKIAAHYEEGREYQPAIRHLMMAAQIASRRYAHRESMAVLEHAKELLPKVLRENRPTLEWEIQEKIADVHYTLGDMAQSIAIYDSLAARAAKSGDRAAEADALMRMSHPAGFVDPNRAGD